MVSKVSARNHNRANQTKSNKIKSNRKIENKLRPLALAIAVAFSGAIPSVAKAAIYTVTSELDTGSGSLREAIGLANASIGTADTINFSIASGSTITLDSPLPDITDNLTITGPTAGDAGSIIIDGNNHRHLKSNYYNVTLENITLQNGLYSTTNTGYSVGGGAIYLKNGNLVLNHCHISNNATSGADAKGGGVFVYTGSVTLNQSTISGNSTDGLNAEGGGLYVFNGSANFTQSTLSGNSTTGAEADGGGLMVYSGYIYLTESTVSGNTTAGLNADGGGVYARSKITLTQSTISGNSVAGTNADGGGIYVYESYNATFTQSSVVENQSVVGAAGLSVHAI